MAANDIFKVIHRIHIHMFSWLIQLVSVYLSVTLKSTYCLGLRLVSIGDDCTSGTCFHFHLILRQFYYTSCVSVDGLSAIEG